MNHRRANAMRIAFEERNVPVWLDALDCRRRVSSWSHQDCVDCRRRHEMNSSVDEVEGLLEDGNLADRRRHRLDRLRRLISTMKHSNRAHQSPDPSAICLSNT